jgi:hypothetical protein
MSKIKKTDLKQSIKKCIEYIDPNVVSLRIFCEIVESDLEVEDVIFENPKLKRKFKEYTLKYLDTKMTNDELSCLMDDMEL